MVSESTAAAPAAAPDRAVRLGVIGLNEGNGHPYSFSAAVNGYDDAGMRESGWGVIYNYLRPRDAADFGITGARVTHAWTQDPAETARLCRAARIDHAVREPGEMLGQIDGLLLCRDDYETHLPLARPFLEAGIPVFIDKPLTLDATELAWFTPYLGNGLLMSCAGGRYARETDPALGAYLSGELGDVLLARGAVVANFSRYGITMLEAIFRVLPCHVEEVWVVPGQRHESVILRQTPGQPLVQIDALGAAAKTFQLDFFGTKGRAHAEINDNFAAFRRLLGQFVRQIRTGEPAIPAAHTLQMMHILMAAERSRAEGRPVQMSEMVI